MKKLPTFRSTALLALVSWVTVGPVSWAQSVYTVEDGSSSRAVSGALMDNLTPEQRKLPLSLVIRGARDARAEISEGSVGSGQLVAARADVERVYIVRGSSALSLSGAVVSVGGAVRSVSSRRPEITAKLTEQMVLDLSRDESVFDIRLVKGPRAQGITDPYRLHRIGELASAPAEQGGPLDGTGVVIGLITLPVSEENLNTMAAVNQVLGAPGRLIPVLAEGPDKRLYVSGNALNSDSLHIDALNLMQIIHDIAPGATIVLDSPGVDGALIDMEAAIDRLVAGDSGAPPVDIIIDDLYFPTDNPFAESVVTQASRAAAEQGVLHLSAAGDHGRWISSNDSNSNVYFADFAPQTASDLGLSNDYEGLGVASLHSFSNDLGILTVKSQLEDLCVFLAEKPEVPNEPGSFSAYAYVYDASNPLANSEGEKQPNSIIGIEVGAPGGCLSEDLFPLSAGLPPNSEIILEKKGDVEGMRLAVIGVRPEDAPLPTMATLPVFDVTTPGSILGHSYDPLIIAVAAAKNCLSPANASYFDCSELSIEDYSSDGESESQPRFYWQDDGAQGFEELPGGGVSAAKPDLSAAGSTGVFLLSQVEGGNASGLPQGSFQGTSAAVASAGGVAALYWQYRQAQVDASPEVYGSEVNPHHVAQALRGSTLDPTPTSTPAGPEPNWAWEARSGWGILDAPKILAGPLPPLDVALSPDFGSMSLDFRRSVNDLVGRFAYEVDCGTFLAKGIVEASDAIEPDQSLPQAPLDFEVTQGTAVTCSVRAQLEDENDPTQVLVSGAITVTAVSLELEPPSIALSSAAAGALLTLDPSPTAELAGIDITYTASCEVDGAAYLFDGGVSSIPILPGAANALAIKAVPRANIECVVIASASGLNGETTNKSSSPASVAAGTVSSTSIMLIPESGGFVVRIDKDSTLVDDSLVIVTLVCTQGSTEVINAVVAGPGIFVDAEYGESVSCSASSTLTLDNSNVRVVFASGSSVLPGEEEEPAGLPIWLLYQATQ